MDAIEYINRLTVTVFVLQFAIEAKYGYPLKKINVGDMLFESMRSYLSNGQESIVFEYD